MVKVNLVKKDASASSNAVGPDGDSLPSGLRSCVYCGKVYPWAADCMIHMNLFCVKRPHSSRGPSKEIQKATSDLSKGNLWKKEKEKEKEKVKAKRVVVKWEWSEVERMARLEAKFSRQGLTGDINSRLLPEMPGRTIFMVRARRSRADYRELLGRIMGELGASPPLAAEAVCPDCGLQCMTKAGLGVHSSSAHPESSNSLRLLKTAKVKARWDHEEEIILARTIVNRPLITLEGLANVLGRSIESVKSKRRTPKIQALVERFRRERADAPSDPDSSGSDSSESSDDDEADRAPGPPAPDPPDPSGSSSDEEEDDLEALRQAILAPLSLEEADDRLSPEQLQAIARGNNRTLEAIDRHMTSCLANIALPPLPNRGPRERPERSPPRNQRARRRHEFRSFQNLYRKSKSKAVKAAIDGTWRTPDSRPNSAAMIGFWRPLLETPDLPEDPGFENAVQHPVLRHLQAPVSAAEVERALKGVGDSASGPDRVPSGALRELPRHSLARMFNAWLWVGSVPPAVSLSVVTLIPKVKGSMDPADYRPIAVGSHLVRAFHRILANRLQVLPVSKFQVAFRPTDGCGLNVTLLESVLHEARTQYKEVSLAFLDMRKAFDTASRRASIKALRLKGVPPLLCSYLHSALSNAPLSLEGEIVQTRRGVKQGDPCSPVIFNCLVDTCLESLTPGLGWARNGHSVPAMSYADDLVLLANTPVGLQTLVNDAAAGFRNGGLEINPRKSATLSIETSVRNSTWAVAPTLFTANGQQLTCMGIGSVYKYLGLPFSAGGSRVDVYAAFDQALESLRSAPLKPQQRLYALRVALLPRLYHSLVLGKARLGMLRRLDIRVRGYVRQFLRLPADLSLGAFYAPVKEGGLGLPLLEVSTKLWRNKRVERILTAEEPAARVIESLSLHESLLRELDTPIRFEEALIPSKRELERVMVRRLHQSVDGAGLHQAAQHPASTSWVSTGDVGCSGSQFVSGLQTRFSVLATPARSFRRGGGGSPECDGGCRTRGTLAHIVQSCPVTHGPRVSRHDFLLSKLENHVGLGGTSRVLAKEPTLRTTEGVRKPDLLVVPIDGRKNVTVVDVQVVSDQDLANSHRLKCDRYDRLAVREAIERQYFGGERLLAFKVTTLTVNWRGCISPESARELARLGIKKGWLTGYSLAALHGSFITYTAYNRTAGHAPRN